MEGSQDADPQRKTNLKGEKNKNKKLEKRETTLQRMNEIKQTVEEWMFLAHWCQ